MDDNFYKKVVEESPTGYAYLRIIYDTQDMPYDCEFVEVNAAFEILIGQRRSDIMGRKLTNLVPKMQNSDFSKIHCFIDIAIHGGKRDFDFFSENLKKRYRVIVSSSG